MSDLPGLPKLLNEQRAEIREAKGFTGAATWNAERWRSKLANEPELERLLNDYPQGLGRSQLRTLSEQAARNQQDGSSYRRLFFATMLWGYGDRAYGPFRVTQMLSGRTALTDGLLREVAQLVMRGEHAEALRSLRAPWLGVSFATKYLYAVGLAYEPRPRPLVLDLLVAAELATLGRAEGFDAKRYVRVYNKQIIRSGSAYQRYIELLDTWGEELGCPAERVEYFLFKQGKARNARKRSHTAPQPDPSAHDAPKSFPAEDAVVDALNIWLDRKGASFEERDHVDVVAREPAGGTLWVIEAKGETSDPGLDFHTCLGQILTAMQGDDARYAVAVPATKSYRRLCEGINDDVRRRLGLHWLFVDQGADVWHVPPDQPLPDAPFAGEPA